MKCYLLGIAAAMPLIQTDVDFVVAVSVTEVTPVLLSACSLIG